MIQEVRDILVDKIVSLCNYASQTNIVQPLKIGYRAIIQKPYCPYKVVNGELEYYNGFTSSLIVDKPDQNQYPDFTLPNIKTYTAYEYSGVTSHKASYVRVFGWYIPILPLGPLTTPPTININGKIVSYSRCLLDSADNIITGGYVENTVIQNSFRSRFYNTDLIYHSAGDSSYIHTGRVSFFDSLIFNIVGIGSIGGFDSLLFNSLIGYSMPSSFRICILNKAAQIEATEWNRVDYPIIKQGNPNVVNIENVGANYYIRSNSGYSYYDALSNFIIKLSPESVACGEQSYQTELYWGNVYLGAFGTNVTCNNNELFDIYGSYAQPQLIIGVY